VDVLGAGRGRSGSRQSTGWGAAVPAARRDLLVVALAAAAIFVLQATAWPLTRGRDFETYLAYFNQFWESAPALPTLMVVRTPVAPFVIGGLHKLGGPLLIEVTLGVCFVLAICAVYAIGATWSRAVAWAGALLTAGYPTYGSTFHLLNADPLLACGVVLWMASVCHWRASASLRGFLGHGVAVFLLVMTHPSAQTLLLFSAFPFIMRRRLDLWRRGLLSAAFGGTVAALLLLYATYNLVRYQDFTVARYGPAVVPFYRVLVVDRIVHPDNGPATRELVRAIEHDLIEREPYRSMGLDVATVLGSADPRVWADLVALSDRVWGWHRDHAMLRAVALEAIRRRPGAYLGGVGATLYSTLTERTVPPAGRRPPVAPLPSSAPGASRAGGVLGPATTRGFSRTAPTTGWRPVRQGVRRRQPSMSAPQEPGRDGRFPPRSSGSLSGTVPTLWR